MPGKTWCQPQRTPAVTQRTRETMASGRNQPFHMEHSSLFIFIVNYYNRYFEIVRLTSCTSPAVITKHKSVVCRRNLHESKDTPATSDTQHAETHTLGTRNTQHADTHSRHQGHTTYRHTLQAPGTHNMQTHTPTHSTLNLQTTCDQQTNSPATHLQAKTSPRLVMLPVMFEKRVCMLNTTWIVMLLESLMLLEWSAMFTKWMNRMYFTYYVLSTIVVLIHLMSFILSALSNVLCSQNNIVCVSVMPFSLKKGDVTSWLYVLKEHSAHNKSNNCSTWNSSINQPNIHQWTQHSSSAACVRCIDLFGWLSYE